MPNKQTIKIIFLICTAFSLSFSPSLAAKTLKYLYIDASEGNASGGHTALRFDKETFHFQHYDGGVIRLVKHLSTDFDYQYRYLENRNFHQANIKLSEQHYESLHEHFNLRFLQQKQQNTLLKEIILNIALLTKQTSHPLISIRGAGLFDMHAMSPETDSQTRTNIKLQELIKQEYGDAYLDNKILNLKQHINSLKMKPWPKSALQLNENSFPAVPYSFANRHIDAVSKLLLLETIQKGRPLNTQYYFSPEHADFKLSKAELEQLKIFRQTLLTHLISLLNSQRPDWGSAGFILYARILSITLTIQLGKFVFLDSYAAQSPSIPYSEVKTYRDLFQVQKDQALAKVKHEKSLLFTAQQAISETNYSHFEMLGNYYYERERGLLSKHAIRISGEQRLPKKPTPLPKYLYPQLTSQQTESALHRLKRYKKEHLQQIQVLYQYDLFTRNCVTEIFSTINTAEINNKQIKELSQLIQKDLIAFIPFGSFRSLPVGYSRQTFPSFRQQQLTKMYKEESSAWVFFREFNTLTANHYKFNNQDSTFLFFTDDRAWSRPLFGVFNLLTATSISIFGGFALPFDSGKTLKNGAMGILMSLPELVFFNIRKGSYKHLVPPIK